MPDVYVDEYKDKDSAEIKAIKTYRKCLEISKDYCKPQFQKALRLYRLFAGHIPQEIEGTLSQVMLNIAYSVIDEELPISMRSMFSEKDWLSLNAEEIKYEPHRDTAQKWIKHQFEKVQQMPLYAAWPIQSAHIMGNGYRFYSHKILAKDTEVKVPVMGPMGMILDYETKKRKKNKDFISGTFVNFFNVFPAPKGSLINSPDYLMDLAMPYLIVMTYESKSYIENEVKKGNFNKKEAAKLLDKKHTDPEQDPSAQFKDETLGTEGEWKQFSAPDWIKKLKDEQIDIDGTYRLAWFFNRGAGTWSCIAEDKYCLYNGKPMIDGWPLASFKSSHDMDNFFGFSLLEVVEDLILSMILNFNMRLDYLAGQFHPATYIPQMLVDQLGGDLSAFDPRPYNYIPYQHKSFPEGIDRAIFHDRIQELPKSALIEQAEMKQYLEEIISQKGLERMGGETATVGASLINKSVARSMLRAINLDLTGIHDCVDITLRFGAKYVNDDDWVNTGAEGIPWEKINHEAITNGYGITINGARNLAQAEETFKKQVAIAPMLLNDPTIRGQIELKRQLLEQGGFDNIDLIINGDGSENPMGELQAEKESGQMPGGIPSFANEARSMSGANKTRQPQVPMTMV